MNTMNNLYSDSTIVGDFFLTPFKRSWTFLSTTWRKEGSSTRADRMKRIASCAIALLATLFTAPLVTLGMAIKSVSCLSSQPPPSSSSEPLQQRIIHTPPPTPSLALPRAAAIETLHPYPGDLAIDQLRRSRSDNGYVHLSFGENDHFSITIRSQDLFESGAKIIVNAANSHLGGGGGIDGAIHHQGGTSYRDGHRALQQRYSSNYTSGYAAIISSGQLQERYGIENVIVVAGPQGNSNGEKETALYSCYFNSLVLAHQAGKESIAFPSISTGIYNFPKERAAKISSRAFYDFVTQYPTSSLRTISIHFLPAEAASLSNYC